MFSQRALWFRAATLLVCLLSACGMGVETQTPTSIVASLTPQSTPTTTNPPFATETLVVEPTKPPPQHPVILISWDGAPADLVNEMVTKGELPIYASLARKGVRAEYALTVNPSLTAPAQNSIASGSLPSNTGIVANRYHNASDSFYWYRSGFEEVMDESEPVWVTASRAGLKTAAVFFPGGTPAHPGQMADYTIGYSVREAYSRHETLNLRPIQDWDTPFVSYSPALESEYQIPNVSRIYFLVTDSTDDGLQNYDRVHISTARGIDMNSPVLGVGDWGSLVLLENIHAGADFLIQELTSEQITFYHTGVYYNTASPRSLLEGLNRNFGFFRAGADTYALEHGWISEEDYLHMLEQNARWMAEVTVWVYATYQPDLLFAWQEAFDAAGHAFYLVDPKQPGFTQEQSERYLDYYKQAARIADQALGMVMAQVNLDEATVVLVSDHGMSPVHSTVYVNTVIEQAGLLSLDERDYVVVDQSRALAFTSGGAMHVYINLAGHEKNGIVLKDEYLSIQNQIVDLFSSLVDPVSGEYVFQRVLAENELDSLNLDHPNSGDVYAQAHPGYDLDGWRGMDAVFAPSKMYGQHGYDSELPEMRAIFLAAGQGVCCQGQLIAPVSVLDIAPTIACLLKFDPHVNVHGEIIPEACNP